MPRIMSGARQIHQAAHFLDRGAEAAIDRLADQEMADVQFHDLGDRGDGGDVVVGQAVARVNLKPEAVGEGRQPLRRAASSASASAMRPSACRSE